MFPDEFPFSRPAGTPADVPGVSPEPPVAPEPPAPPAVSAVGGYGGPERRQTARQPLSVKASLRIGSDHAPRQQTCISDISLLGVAFEHDSVIEPGQRCIMRIEAGPLRWSTRLQVVHCRRHAMDPARYRIGCRFISNELLRDRPAA